MKSIIRIIELGDVQIVSNHTGKNTMTIMLRRWTQNW